MFPFCPTTELEKSPVPRGVTLKPPLVPGTAATHAAPPSAAKQTSPSAHSPQPVARDRQVFMSLEQNEPSGQSPPQGTSFSAWSIACSANSLASTGAALAA